VIWRRRPMSDSGPSLHFAALRNLAGSLIGRLGSSTFRPSTAACRCCSRSCFSSESAPRPFHHGVRRRGGTIYRAALPSDERRIQATKRTHLIHRPARDIMPPRGGALVPLITFDPARLSCRHGFPGPAKLGAVNPDAMHDHGGRECFVGGAAARLPRSF
jgi:hypothetical protein